jgi:thiamine-monophosphate kinase
LDKHLKPRARFDISRKIAPLANAMIDISDGLGSETGHICKQSRLGADIFSQAIPLHPDVVRAGEILEIDPLSWAISGGEDYELLFSIPEERLGALVDAGLQCHDVGRMTAFDSNPRLVRPDGESTPLSGGYDHFL